MDGVVFINLRRGFFVCGWLKTNISSKSLPPVGGIAPGSVALSIQLFQLTSSDQSKKL